MKPDRAAREYQLYRFVKKGVTITPRPLLGWFGSMVGALFFLLHPRRRIVLRNLQMAFPDKPRGWRVVTGLRCGSHFGRITFDFIKLATLQRADLLNILPIEGIEHLTSALAKGRGAFVLSGHYGNWEMAAQVMALHGLPQEMVVRPLDNPHLDEEISAIRTRYGNRLIPKRGALRSMIRALKDNRVVDILIDQYVPPDGSVMVPFLGIETPTLSSLANIVIRTGAPVVPLISRREGPRYRSKIYPPIRSGSNETVENLTAEFNRFLQERIRECPHQWLWFHDRWGIRKGGGSAGRRTGGEER